MYAKVWREWCGLLGQVDSGVGTGRVTALLFFIGLNYERGVSASAMDRKIAGLVFWFKVMGEGDATSEFMVRQALKGYRRGTRSRDSRQPITLAILEQLLVEVSNVCTLEYEAALFRVAFVLAFYGAFRLGELVSPSQRAQGGLQFGDVHCGYASVALFLRRSKTDRAGKSKYVHVYAIPGGVSCPVTAVRNFLGFRPASGGSFLVHGDGSSL